MTTTPISTSRPATVVVISPTRPATDIACDVQPPAADRRPTDCSVQRQRDPWELRSTALAMAAGLHLGVPLEHIRVRRRAGRRPLASYLGRRVYVSVTTTKGAVLAAAHDGPVGIDVERIRDVREAAAISARLDGIAGTTGLLQAWTRYESITKALGVGLTLTPDRLVVWDGPVVLDGQELPLLVTDLDLDQRSAPIFCASITARSGSPPMVHYCSIADLFPAHNAPTRITGSQTDSPPNQPIRKDPAMPAVLDKEVLRQTIADTLDVDVTEVTDHADFREDLEVDSLMALELLVVLERSYSVKLDESKLPEITSLEKAYLLLEAQLLART